jgi:hypothetical protein
VVVVVVVVVVPAASYMYMREQAAWIVSIDTFSSFSFYRPLASRCRSPPSLSVHQRVQFSSCLLLGRLRPNLPSSSPDCDGRQERHRPAPARVAGARAPPPPAAVAFLALAGRGPSATGAQRGALPTNARHMLRSGAGHASNVHV